MGKMGQLTLKGLDVKLKGGEIIRVPWSEVAMSDHGYVFTEAARKRWPQLPRLGQALSLYHKATSRWLIRRAISQSPYRHDWALSNQTGNIRMVVIAILLFIPLILVGLEPAIAIPSVILRSIIDPASALPGAPYEYQLLLSSTAVFMSFMISIVMALPFWIFRRHLVQAIAGRRITRLVTYANRIEVEWQNGVTKSIPIDAIARLQCNGEIIRRHGEAPIAFRPKNEVHWNTFVRAFNTNHGRKRTSGLTFGFKLRLSAYFAALPCLIVFLNRHLPPLDGRSFLPGGVLRRTCMFVGPLILAIWFWPKLKCLTDRFGTALARRNREHRHRKQKR